jgi:hypothetical protein
MHGRLGNQLGARKIRRVALGRHRRFLTPFRGLFGSNRWAQCSGCNHIRSRKPSWVARLRIRRISLAVAAWTTRWIVDFLSSFRGLHQGLVTTGLSSCGRLDRAGNQKEEGKLPQHIENCWREKSRKFKLLEIMARWFMVQLRQGNMWSGHVRAKPSFTWDSVGLFRKHKTGRRRSCCSFEVQSIRKWVRRVSDILRSLDRTVIFFERPVSFSCSKSLSTRNHDGESNGMLCSQEKDYTSSTKTMKRGTPSRGCARPAKQAWAPLTETCTFSKVSLV